MKIFVRTEGEKIAQYCSSNSSQFSCVAYFVNWCDTNVQSELYCIMNRFNNSTKYRCQTWNRNDSWWILESLCFNKRCISWQVLVNCWSWWNDNQWSWCFCWLNCFSRHLISSVKNLDEWNNVSHWNFDNKCFNHNRIIYFFIRYQWQDKFHKTGLLVIQSKLQDCRTSIKNLTIFMKTVLIVLQSEQRRDYESKCENEHIIFLETFDFMLEARTRLLTILFRMWCWHLVEA